MAWVITTIPSILMLETNKNNPRSVGIFYNKKDAISVLENDYGNLSENGWYKWAVIEFLQEGLYPTEPHPDLPSSYYYRRENKWEACNSEPSDLTLYREKHQLVPWWHSIG